MTRNDFELIARTLRETRPPSTYTGSDGHVQANVTAHAMADMLAGVNARFNRKMFLTACGAGDKP